MKERSGIGGVVRWGAWVVLVACAILAGATAGGASASPGKPALGGAIRQSAPAAPMPTCVAGWGVVSSPSVGAQDNFFNGIAVVSASDIWAVGLYYNDSFVSQTLTERWDGTAWSIVPSPSPDGLGNELQAVTAVAANDVWAVGSSWVGLVHQ